MAARLANRDANRVALLDIMRGYALLIIPVNHLWAAAAAAGIAAWHIPTTTMLGFSTSAEVLVFTSGYAFALANQRRMANQGILSVQHSALRRALRLLAVNALMLALIWLALAALRFNPGGTLPRIWQVLLTPGERLLDLPGHLAHPIPTLFTFDILPLYAIILALAPVAKRGLRRHPWLTMSASALLYGLACFGPLDHAALGIEPESFNPLAWQAVFMLGMRASMQGWLRKPPSLWLVPAVAAILVAGLFWALSQRYPLSLPFVPAVPELPFTGHADLGLLPILHFLSMICATAWAYHALPARFREPLEATLGIVGRSGLVIYVIGNILQFAAVPLLAELGPLRGVSVAVSAALAVALVLLARWRMRKALALRTIIAT